MSGHPSSLLTSHCNMDRKEYNSCLVKLIPATKEGLEFFMTLYRPFRLLSLELEPSGEPSQFDVSCPKTLRVRPSVSPSAQPCCVYCDVERSSSLSDAVCSFQFVTHA